MAVDVSAQCQGRQHEEQAGATSTATPFSSPPKLTAFPAGEASTVKRPLIKIAALLAVLAGLAVIVIEILRFDETSGGWLWIIVGALAIAFGGYELLFAKDEPVPPPP
jgi:hypothetical protein